MTAPATCGIIRQRWRDTMIRIAALGLAAMALAACTTLPAATGDTASLRAIDRAQMEAVAAGDIAALEALAHPDLRINAPTGRILTHQAFFANMRSGAIRAEAFTRTPEEFVISGNVGTVMGSEVFTPAANSDLGKQYGAVPLQRRYTNIYIWQDGHWRWLARHANVAAQT
jgi:hypothetical protein